MLLTSVAFPSITFTLLIFLLQKLKEQIAQVFAEIECFQNEERQETDHNPGEQTRQVEQDGYSFVYKVSLLMLRKQKHQWDLDHNKDRKMMTGMLFCSEISLSFWAVRHLTLGYLSCLVSVLSETPLLEVWLPFFFVFAANCRRGINFCPWVGRNSTWTLQR